MTLGRSDEYKKAGVNIDAASEWVLRIKELAARSHSDAVLSGIGGVLRALLYEGVWC